MPRRLQVRMTRQAISPRLAIRILSKGGLAAVASALAAAFGAAFFAAFFLAAILTILLYCGRTGHGPRRYGTQSTAAKPSAPTATQDIGCWTVRWPRSTP